MFTTRARLFMAFAFALTVASSAFTGEYVFPDRNLPVDPNYHNIGDQKYDDNMYQGYTRSNVDPYLQNSPEDLLGPDRNLPVDVDYVDKEDREYAPEDYTTPYPRQPQVQLPGIPEPDRNLPVRNDFLEPGDPEYSKRDLY